MFSGCLGKKRHKKSSKRSQKAGLLPNADGQCVSLVDGRDEQKSTKDVNGWQRNHIRKNLPELAQMTDCTVELLARLQADNVLSREDVDILHVCGSSKGKIAQSSRLYEIVQTKANGYEFLTKALFQSKQSGALKIQLDGFRNERISDPLDKCGILINYHTVLEAEVRFQGQMTQLQELVPDFSIKCVEDALKDLSCQYDYIDIFVTKEKKFVLAETNIPPKPQFYIDRSISNRQKLNPDIFKQECSDVFVFNGIDRSTISALVHPNPTSASSRQLQGVTARFILLDDDVDWEEIEKMCSTTLTPAHLIKVEAEIDSSEDQDDHGDFRYSDMSLEAIYPGSSDVDSDYKFVNDNSRRTKFSYILEGSTGNSNILRRFVLGTNSDQKAYCMEQEFVEDMYENDVSRFYICDTPGMGKSWLLASLARRISQRHPNRLLVFIPLATLALKTKEMLQTEIGIKESILEHLLGYVSTASLSRSILRTAINSGAMELELFLDGLDEIPVEDMDWTTSQIKAAMEQSSNVRIYVTSRPHLRDELESTLGTVAYDILPFTQENQLQYLTHAWEQQNPKSDQMKLRTFASACIQNLKNTLSRQKHDIMGTPLQCRILSDVYGKAAAMFADPRRNQKLPQLSPTSIHQMYKLFIEMRFKSSHPLKRVSKIESRHYHVWRALKLLYPEIASQYALYTNVYQGEATSEHLAIGILESRCHGNEKTSDFLHRSIAEFIAAEYFVEVLTQRDSVCKQLDRYVLEYIGHVILQSPECLFGQISMDKIFKKSDFPDQQSILFINDLLQSKPEASCNEFTAMVLISAWDPNDVFRLLHSIISNGYSHMFRYIKHILGCLTEQELEPYVSFFKTASISVPGGKIEPAVMLLCSSVILADSPTVKECFQLFLVCFDQDPGHLHHRISACDFAPLKLAVEKGDFDAVEYLVTIFPITRQSLIFHCVANTYQKPESAIAEKTEIFKLLLRKDKNVIYELGQTRLNFHNHYDYYGGGYAQRGSKYTDPLYAPNIHPQFIKLIMEHRANVDVANIFHHAARYMTSPDLLKLCGFLFTEGNCDKHRRNEMTSSLHGILRKGNVEVELINLIHTNGLLNSEDDRGLNGDNLALSAVRGNNSLDVIKELVQLGSDMKYINQLQETALHLSAENQNVEAIDYLLSLSLSLTCKDTSGRTPLHRSLRHPEITKHLISKGAYVLATDNAGDNIAHMVSVGWLASRSFQPIVELILKHDPTGDAFTQKNNKGKTPLQLYLDERNWSKEALELLLNIPGVNSIHVNEYGDNLFQLALRNMKNVDTLKLIISHGSSFCTRDKFNQSSLDIAVKCGHIAAIRYLFSLYKAENGVDMISLLDQVANLISVCFDASVGLKLVRILTDELSLWSSGTPTIAKKASNENTGVIKLSAISSSKNGAEILLKHFSMLTGGIRFQDALIKILRENHYLKIPVSKSGDDNTSNRKFARTDESGDTLKNGVGFDEEVDNNYEWRALNGIQLFKALIQFGVNVNIADCDGNTLLHRLPYAPETPKEYHDMVDFLVVNGSGAEFRVRNQMGETPVHIAIKTLDVLPTTLALLSCCSHRQDGTEQNPCCFLHPNDADESGNSVLHTAAIGRRNLTFIKNLLQLQMNHIIPRMNDNVLKEIVCKQNYPGNTFVHLLPQNYSNRLLNEIVDYIIDSGLQDTFTMVNHAGQMPLHFVGMYITETGIPNAFMPKLKTIPLIHNKYPEANTASIAELNSADENENSILHLTVFRSRQKFLKCLIQLASSHNHCNESKPHLDLDLMNRNKRGNTFVHFLPKYFSAAQYHDIVQFLLDGGLQALFWTRNMQGETPVHFAVYNRELLPETLGLLAKCSNSKDETMTLFNVADNSGNSILYNAVLGERSLTLIQQLLRLGANWNTVNNHKRNMAHVSASCGLLDHLKYFVELGCNINVLDNDRNNVLQCAVIDCKDYLLEIVNYLHESGADVQNRNMQGKTAYDLAVEKGIEEESILTLLQ